MPGIGPEGFAKRSTSSPRPVCADDLGPIPFPMGAAEDRPRLSLVVLSDARRDQRTDIADFHLTHPLPLGRASRIDRRRER